PFTCIDDVFSVLGAAGCARRWRFRHGGAVVRDPVAVVQDDRPARVQDGADPSPLREKRMERAEGDQPVRDSGDSLRVVIAGNAEVAVSEFDVRGKRVTVAGAARSGIAASELLVKRGARVTLSETGTEVNEAERL